MKINEFKDVIINLPVERQSITTIRSNKKWERAENKFCWLRDFNSLHFGNNLQITISREDLFNINGNLRELILKTI